MTTTEIWGRDVTPRAGLGVETDACGYARRLVPCDDWDAAPFRLESMYDGGPAVACRVDVTGRTLHRAPYTGTPRVRVRVTFVGDGEPDTTCGGWMYLEGA